jgi:hypothetical protein
MLSNYFLTPILTIYAEAPSNPNFLHAGTKLLQDGSIVAAGGMAMAAQR